MGRQKKKTAPISLRTLTVLLFFVITLKVALTSSYPGPEAMYEYDLFAVINHDGQIDNGHYTNFARFQDEVSLLLTLRSQSINQSGSGIALTMTSENGTLLALGHQHADSMLF